MSAILIQLIIGAYASVGVIATVGYIPTIKDLLNKKMSVNIQSYMIFTFCSATTFLYTMTMFSDWLLQTVNGLNFICCSTILGLSILLKQKRR